MSESNFEKKFLPKTKLGKLSVILMLTFFVFFFLGFVSTNLYRGVPAGNSILADVKNRPFLAIFIILSLFSAVVSMIIGIIAVIKKERFFLVYFAILIGFLITFFCWVKFFRIKK